MNKKIRFAISFLIVVLALTACNQSYKTSEGDGNHFSQTEKTNVEIQPNTAAEIYVKKQVPVLCYHRIENGRNDEYTVSPATFDAHMKALADSGYHSISPDQYYEYLAYNAELPEKPVMITFDDGYMDNYYSAFPILKEFNMTATIFCIASELDGSYYLSKDAIKEMSDYGIDIESHTVTHPHLNKLEYNKQLEELAESKKILENITGKEISSIAYPFGDFNDNSIKAAKEAGYVLGFTTKLGLSDRNDNPFALDRIYISSKYELNTFKELLSKTKK